MSMQGRRAFHPNGERIIGTLEVVEGRGNINPGTFSRGEDGDLDFDYQGTTELFWDEQTSQREEDERIFISEDGEQCLESEVELR